MLCVQIERAAVDLAREFLESEYGIMAEAGRASGGSSSSSSRSGSGTASAENDPEQS
jgi:hypothetical protein